MNQWNAKHAWAARLLPAVASAGVFAMVTAVPVAAAAPTNGLVARYDFNGNANDASGKGHHGVVRNATLTSNRFGNGQQRLLLQRNRRLHRDPGPPRLQRRDDRQAVHLGVDAAGHLDVPRPGGIGVRDWLGKGVADQHEWAFRMYSSDNTEGRGNRTSFYLFNLAGGLGAGSYVQEAVAPGTWYHYVAVVDMSTDTIKWYKNGVLRDQDPFINSEYRINPRNGTAPVRVGTKDFASHFKGAIDNLAVYNRALSASEVVQLYNDTTP